MHSCPRVTFFPARWKTLGQELTSNIPGPGGCSKDLQEIMVSAHLGTAVTCGFSCVQFCQSQSCPSLPNFKFRTTEALNTANVVCFPDSSVKLWQPSPFPANERGLPCQSLNICRYFPPLRCSPCLCTAA